MTEPVQGGSPGRPSPRWFHLLIGAVGVFVGLLYLFTAFTSGPLTRNLIVGSIWGGLGLLWLITGVVLPGKRTR